MDKRILMVLLGALLTACTSGPVRVHGADFSVDDAHIRVTDGYYRYHGAITIAITMTTITTMAITAAITMTAILVAITTAMTITTIARAAIAPSARQDRRKKGAASTFFCGRTSACPPVATAVPDRAAAADHSGRRRWSKTVGRACPAPG